MCQTLQPYPFIFLKDPLFCTVVPNTAMCFSTHLLKCCDTKGAELTVLSDEMGVKITVKGTTGADDQPGMKKGE